MPREVLLFHFDSCPFCKQARDWLKEIQAEDPELAAVPVETARTVIAAAAVAVSMAAAATAATVETAAVHPAARVLPACPSAPMPPVTPRAPHRWHPSAPSVWMILPISALAKSSCNALN